MVWMSFFFMLLLFVGMIMYLKGSLEEDLYRLAIQRSRLRTNSTEALLQIHLLRVPKAGSTSLSIIARRFVGCHPPGPCCKYPGDPPGSCPHRDLFNCQLQHKVIGCTGHNADYETLLSNAIPTISIVREPISRSISGFFYPNHHNMNCHADIPTCFEAYTRDTHYQNILVKMLTGQAAYSNIITCHLMNECNHSLELAVQNLVHLEFIGILELWELSLLVLHMKFPQLPPVKEEFLLYSSSNASEVSTVGGSVNTMDESHRVNRDHSYSQFQKTAREQYYERLIEQNKFDIKLYHQLLRRFCDEVRSLQLWEIKIVKDYWQEKVHHHNLTYFETECTLPSIVE